MKLDLLYSFTSEAVVCNLGKLPKDTKLKSGKPALMQVEDL
jgi:hypothetical protein